MDIEIPLLLLAPVWRPRILIGSRFVLPNRRAEVIRFYCCIWAIVLGTIATTLSALIGFFVFRIEKGLERTKAV